MKLVPIIMDYCLLQWSGMPFPLTAGPLWSSLEVYLLHSVRRRHPKACFATVPFAVPWAGLSAGQC